MASSVAECVHASSGMVREISGGKYAYGVVVVVSGRHTRWLMCVAVQYPHQYNRKGRLLLLLSGPAVFNPLGASRWFKYLQISE